MTQSEDRSPGEAAIQAAIDTHGEDIAAAITHSEDVKNLIDTIVLVLASANDQDVESITRSLSNLIATGDALATTDTPELAAAVGENAMGLASALETLVRLEENGSLEDLAELAEFAGAVELNEASVRGMNRVIVALGEADQTAEPLGLLGALRATRTPSVRSGLGFLVGVLRGLDPRDR